MDSNVVIASINIKLDTELRLPHNNDRELRNVARKSIFLGKDKNIHVVFTSKSGNYDGIRAKIVKKVTIDTPAKFCSCLK